MKHLKSVFSFVFISIVLSSAIPANVQAHSSTDNAEKSLGLVDLNISCNEDVATQFNQGLALLHNMMYMQAEQAFQAAADLDPKCPMPYWGVAMSLFHPLWAPPSNDELQRGWEAIQKASALKPATDRERDYIKAANAIYQDWKSVDHVTRISNWEKHQHSLFKAYPEDIDAGALYALSHLATAPKGDRTFSHQKTAGALLEKLYTKAPTHPGVFHYTIHAYDNPILASRALKLAKQYDKIAPDAPHAQHMPSHIFVRMGLWELTAEWNIRSAEAAKKQSKPGELSLHYIHALDYLIYSYLQTAQDEKAKDILNTINNVETFQDSFASAYGIAAAQARYSLELKQWNEAANLKARTHSTFPWDKYPWFESITYFTRGLGAARSNDASNARKSIAILNDLYEQSRKADQKYWGIIIDAQLKTVAAWTAYSEGKTDQALQMMEEAADIEDSVDKHPVTPGAVLPARELLGDMYAMSGKFGKAINAYEASLTISPNRFNSIYGAGQAAENSGDFEKANYYYSKLMELNGDANNRPSFQKAQKFLSQMNKV